MEEQRRQQGPCEADKNQTCERGLESGRQSAARPGRSLSPGWAEGSPKAGGQQEPLSFAREVGNSN